MTSISTPIGRARASRGLVGRRDVNRRRMARLGWGFSAPALIIVAAVTIFPIVYSVVLSLSNVTVTGSGIKLGGSTGSNYVQVVENSTWQYALGFTIIYTIITVLVELVLGTLIALVLQRLAAGRGWMMALLLIPWSMITVINAELWGYIYQGTYGAAGALVGLPDILGIPIQAIIGLMIADMEDHPVRGHHRAVRAGHAGRGHLRGGRGGWRLGSSTFWRITVPLLRPTLALAVLFRVLQAFGLFDLPYVMTNGGPGTSTTSLAILGYKAIFQNLSFGPGAAVNTTGGRPGIPRRR